MTVTVQLDVAKMILALPACWTHLGLIPDPHLPPTAALRGRNIRKDVP